MAHRPQLAPLLQILVPLFLALLLAAGALLYALDQPWLGLKLSTDGNQSGLRIVSVAPDGPSSAVPVGALLAGLSDTEGNRVELETFDASEDPDLAPNYRVFDRFLERQQRIYAIVSQQQLTLELADGRTFVVTPATSRPITSLPADFWILIFTGLASVVIGSWTYGFSRGVDAVNIWALGCAALVLSTFPPAIYITRELALNGSHFRLFSAINFAGSFAFCALLLMIFLLYPRRLAPRWMIAFLLAGIPVWCVIEFFHFGLSGPETGRYLLQAVLATAASVAALTQYFLAKGEPLKRAAVGWFGLSIAICSAIFIVLFVVPSLLGRPPDVPQWIAYALGLVVHTSLALGISRYRLFDLEPWAFRVLFYIGGTAIFVTLDVLLVAAVSLEALPAFSLALAAVVFFYLPLRSALLDRLMPERRQKLQFREVIDVALAANLTERNARWVTLMQNAFNPLKISPSTNEMASKVPRIGENGLSLQVPGVGAVTPLHLSHAHAGRRLFSSRHLEIAEQLCDMLAYASESRTAYERGIHEERSRIARDMHDNIGAKLLTALHSTAHDRKDVMIREAVSELRGIINNVSGVTQVFEEYAADLRLETAERLSDAGLELQWSMSGELTAPLTAVAAHAMRSIVREGVSNTLRHANATQMRISISLHNGQMAIAMIDNGTGSIASADVSQGAGLAGMRARLERLNGNLDIDRNGAGFSLSAVFPLQRAAAE